MRVDLFLRVAGILKTRSLSGHACDGGFVKVNGRAVKPSARLSPGDRIDMVMPDGRDASFVVDAMPKGRQVPKRDRGLLFHPVPAAGEPCDDKV